jgi:hypothetical protein
VRDNHVISPRNSRLKKITERKRGFQGAKGRALPRSGQQGTTAVKHTTLQLPWIAPRTQQRSLKWQTSLMTTFWGPSCTSKLKGPILLIGGFTSESWGKRRPWCVEKSRRPCQLHEVRELLPVEPLAPCRCQQSSISSVPLPLPNRLRAARVVEPRERRHRVKCRRMPAAKTKALLLQVLLPGMGGTMSERHGCCRS